MLTYKDLLNKPICVYLRSSAVRDFDMYSLHRIPIGAPNSQKYLYLSSYEFVLSSLSIFYLALCSLCSSAVNNQFTAKIAENAKLGGNALCELCALCGEIFTLRLSLHAGHGGIDVSHA
ncbi:MAG: hypothetical protein OIN85_00465 [Candidatus Methanoperedens sp.]|nr:hypothetical protein [Candidatus Methanoperedens sp.]